MDNTIIELAMENLNKVVKALDVEVFTIELSPNGTPENDTLAQYDNKWYRLKTKRGVFAVSRLFIHYIGWGTTGATTCYYPIVRTFGVNIPWPEAIAEALLLLNDKPELFEYIKEYRHHPWI